MWLLAVFSLCSFLGWARAQAPKAVFAHFMVGNTQLFTYDDWKQQINYAKYAGIDAFALNMAYNDSTNAIALPMAFEAADASGFKLFLSFDYAGNGAWPKNDVTLLILQWASRPAYFKRGSQALVSTFEGPGNMTDWPDIKRDTGCFFMPDWSSIGAQPAAAAKIADGLFSWDAWPKGPADMTTYGDASYFDFLRGLPYMMPVSPWFYTNMPGYGKNWLWRGDNLWFDRWQQVLSLDQQPDYVQIISWNDFGESHYIGPLDDKQYVAFTTGRAPFNYVKGMPHDGFRNFLPYIISLYKTGTAKITSEGLIIWYRLNPNGACSDGETTGNTATQLQLEFDPNLMMGDKVFYSALLTSPAQVTVTIDGVAQSGTWDHIPYGGVGIYYGSVDTRGATGNIVVTLARNGKTELRVDGATITRVCTNGLNNYNAWTGGLTGVAIPAVSSGTNLASLNCTQGFGVYDFIGLCSFNCANGYCPSSACTCMNKGVASPPPGTGGDGYPLPGKSIIYSGLCSFACNHNYCPEGSCGKTPNKGVIPTSSPFLPPACTAGAGEGAFQGLCSFGCNFGFCPMRRCKCTQTGTLIDQPPRVNVKGYFLGDGNDHGLCNFACSHGYCPDVCAISTTPGDDPGRDGGVVVTLDPAVWTAHTAVCPPPCTIVFPPTTLEKPTTIQLPPLVTSLEVGWSTTITRNGRISSVFTAITITTTIVIPAVTTSVISFSNFHVTTTLSEAVPSIIFAYPSVSPPPFTITPTVLGVTAPAVPRTIRPPPWPFSRPVAPAPTGTSTSSSTIWAPPVGIIPWGTDTDTVAVTRFPEETISWVSEWIPEPTVKTVNGHAVPVLPCWVWFIWVCPPRVGGWLLLGWRIPGIYPRGGPPKFGPGPFPPGISLPPIPWPEITIGRDMVPRFRTPEPDEKFCETATARICTTTESYDVVDKRRDASPLQTPAPPMPYGKHLLQQHKRATTTATRTVSFCTSVTGCGATDITETTSIMSTAKPDPQPHIIIPKDPKRSSGIRGALQDTGADFYESASGTLGTMFFFVSKYTIEQGDSLGTNAEVLDVYIPKGVLTSLYWGPKARPQEEDVNRSAPRSKKRPPTFNSTDPAHFNSTYAASSNGTYRRTVLMKRDEVIQSVFMDKDKTTGEMVLLSWPPGSGHVPFTGESYRYDSSAGYGTFLYGCDYGINQDHNEFSDMRITPLYPGPNPLNSMQEIDSKEHGSCCMAKAAGKTLGIARRASVIQTFFSLYTSVYETWIDALLKIYDHIRSNGRGTKSVVNISIYIDKGELRPSMIAKWALVIRELLALGVVVVTGSGNGAGYPDGYPASFLDPADANHIPDLFVVGSATFYGGFHDAHKLADWLTCFAPGLYISLPDRRVGGYNGYRRSGGTSFSSAQVAGLAAYFRGIDPQKFASVAAVRQQILTFAYMREKQPADGPNARMARDVIYNGQAYGRNMVDQCEIKVRGRTELADGDSCPLAWPPTPSSVTFSTGLPSPTCAAGSSCGALCRGYFCQGSPIEINPDFLDPRNPGSVQNPTGPNYGNWDSSPTFTASPPMPTLSKPPVTEQPTRTTTNGGGEPTVNPTKLNAMKIMFYAGVPDEDGHRNRAWYYMIWVQNGNYRSLCDDIYKPFDYTSYSELDNVPVMAPDNDFNGREIFPGYGNCRYHDDRGEPGHPGYITCDNHMAFVCEDDSSGPSFECRGDIPKGMVAPGLVPSVVCRFPALN